STYTWSFVSGALPPGLAIAPTGLFSGTPSTPGLYTFVLRAADGSNSANYGQRQFTLRVLPVGVGPLFVLTSSLPSGRVSATYPQTSLQSSGGTGPVTWKLAFNSYLPPGVTLGPNGVLSGVPTGSGQFSFTVIATDAGRQTASRSLSIAVSPAPPRRAGSDFNGDGKSDAGIFRPSVMPDALWYSTPTGGGSPFQIFFGASGDVPVVGDYDGDGRADAVIWRPSTGLWYGPRTGAAQIAIQLVLGQMGDIPVPCDYNGDGAIDPAYYRPSTGQWFGTTANGSTVVLNTNLGLVAGDIPAPADYDGDGKCDPGIMRPGVGPGARTSGTRC